HILALEVERARQDPVVVGLVAKARWQHRRVGMVELHAHRPPGSTDGYRSVQPAILVAQLVEAAQRLAGEPTKLGMVTLAFQLADYYERKHHVVFGESADRPRVGQQHRGV